MAITSNNTLQVDEIKIKSTPFLERALPLARLGIRVFPCDVRGKEPLLIDAETGRRLSPRSFATCSEQFLRNQWEEKPEVADCNVGCFFPRGGENFVVDIDSISECERILGRPLSFSGVAEVQSSTSDKRHCYFNGTVPEWFWAFNVSYKDDDKHELFSVRNQNRYTVGPGSVHPSGAIYTWLQGMPEALPPVNETLLRELLEIAEKQGAYKPDPKVDGEPMPAEQYEAWVENLRNNFERLELSLCEERISRRHGGVEFVFHPCPLGDHDSGNNTGLITVAPSGKIGWHCFHSSHSMPWREARKMIEDQAGAKFTFSKFTFTSGPEVITGSSKSEPQPEPVEETQVEFAPESVPRLEIDKADYIDHLADELTRETRLPFSFARETLKMLFLATLPDTRPVLPWLHTLHTRQYVVLVSDTPGAGKGETWRRCRATIEKAGEAFRLEFINGDQLGSPEWACVAFGGERETKRMLASPKSIEPSIHVEIGPRGRIVYYDEGKKLFQKDSIGKGSERGLLTMFTSLFESNQHATGSFSNGKAEVKKADVSLMLHFTRPGFDKCFMGSGATRDGFLSRCCVVSDYGNELTGEWRRVDSATVRKLVEAIQGCLTRTELPEDGDARDARLEYLRFLRRQDQTRAARLEFLFIQDLYARALFSAEGRMTAEVVRRATRWTQHQLLTRQALWPMDTSSDKDERMYHALRAAYKKYEKLTHRQAKKLCNLHREGTGGISVYQRVHTNLLRTHEIEQAGLNRKRQPIFKWAGD